jgi:peptidoglycan/xylan/chitin deacetylase (PgdA/CDA1 family)
VTPRNFQEHLEHLSRYYNPISLRDLKKALDARRIPHKSVVITFDDGYADNLHNGYPMLESYGIPATIFVTSECVGMKQAFWGRELERLLLWSDRLPKHLRVTIKGKVHEWDLGNGAQHTEARTEEYWRWNVTLESCPTARHKAYRELCYLLRPLDAATLEVVLSELTRQAEFSNNKYPAYRSLNWDELKVLSGGGLVEIASHTVSHPVLACQPIHVQRWEVAESKRQLESMSGHPIVSISYPYGAPADIGQDAPGLVKEAGYESACANFPAPVTRASDPYYLPRYLVRDWDGEEFARRVRRAFEG